MSISRHQFYISFVLSMATIVTATTATHSAHAQEVEAELSLGVQSLASAGAEFSGGADARDSAVGIVDFSDTALLLRGRILLYPNIRGGSIFGLQFPDSDSELGVIFFHQAYVFVESRYLDIKVGRSRVQSSIVEFPTLRDDDMLPFTDSLNPFSSGSTSEDHQYGNVLEVAGNLASQYFLSAHAEHMFLTPGDSGSVDFTLNSMGASMSYRNIPARIRNGFVREAGVGFNFYDANGDGRSATWNIIAGGAFNLYPDPIHLVEFRVQGIYNDGESSAALADPNSTFRARSIRGSASLRYLYSKSMIPKFQSAIIGGYSRYVDDGNATSWSAVANGFYSLGAQFDVGLQYQVRSDSARIRSALGTPEYAQSIQAVFRFGYELTVNALPNRDSVLNNEHSYIP